MRLRSRETMTVSPFTSDLLSITDPKDLAPLFGFPKYSALSYLVYPSPLYTTFTIKKKNGSIREIHAPSKKLKQVQRQLLVAFDELDSSRPSVHGFRKDRNVVTNAVEHSGTKKYYVFNVDLKDFFPSITFPRVFGVFTSAPFNLPKNVAAVLARICTFKGTLPQGAPTSPSLSNYICRSLDGKLQELAKKHSSTYTRYADDLTFSFTRKQRESLPKEIVNLSGTIPIVGTEFLKCIEENSFNVNLSKVRLRSRHARMEVTGLTVNEFPNVTRKYVDEVRGMLHSWKKYGLKNAQTEFALKKIYKRHLRSEAKPPFHNVLRGKLLYLFMVKGSHDKVYNSLARKFNACVNSTPSCSTKLLKVSSTASSEQDLEKTVFLISARNSAFDFEIKGTCFFLEGVGVVTCEHVLKYPSNTNSSGVKVHSFPDLYEDEYIGYSHGEIFIQDINETDICELEVVWLSKGADVAVLQPKSASLLEHLYLGIGTADLKTKEVVLAGFPTHNPGKSLSIAEGKIRSRYRKWGLQHYDITPLIRQGNSGGPVLNLNFQLVGLAKEGEKQDSGNNGVLQVGEILGMQNRYNNLQGPIPHNSFWKL